MNFSALSVFIRRNPATNIRFNNWVPTTSRNRNLLLSNTSSEKMLRTLHARFGNHNSRHQVRTNALAPLLGNGHFFKGQGGPQYFFDLKEGHLTVYSDDVKYSVAPFHNNRPLFTWRYVRDWLLLIPSGKGKASVLLIP